MGPACRFAPCIRGMRTQACPQGCSMSHTGCYGHEHWPHTSKAFATHLQHISYPRPPGASLSAFVYCPSPAFLPIIPYGPHPRGPARLHIWRQLCHHTWLGTSGATRANTVLTWLSTSGASGVSTATHPSGISSSPVTCSATSTVGCVYVLSWTSYRPCTTSTTPVAGLGEMTWPVRCRRTGVNVRVV